MQDSLRKNKTGGFNLKVLFYIANIEHEGGAERVMSIVVNGLSRKGYSIILVNDFPTNAKEYEMDANVKRQFLEKEASKKFWLRNLGRIRSLRRIIKNEKPDIVVSFLFYQNIRMIFSSMFLSVKKVLSVRNDPKKDIGESKIMKLFANYIYGKADGIVFQTEEEREYFSKRVQKHSTIILNPIDNYFYQVERNKNPHNIVSIGRLAVQKNQEMLIKAFSKIKNEFQEDNVYIYGDGELETYLKKLIEKYDLSHRVYLGGRISDVTEKLRNAKLFVLTSDYEGLPNALMEAMAVGTPSISTDCSGGGPKMLIQDGVDGKFVECDNIEQLAIEMENALSNEKLLEKYSKNSKKRADEFRTPNVIASWEEYLSGILKE